VEQNLPLVCGIANRVYAFNDGRVVAELIDRKMITPEVCEKYL
jgi:ABC-type branched-subunit amino acid transport system ATPase component